MPFVSTDQSTFYSDQNTYRFTVRENSPSGTVIGKIQFQGSGDGTVYYTLLGPDTDKISLGPDGTLTLRSGVELDFEAEGATQTLRIDISAIFFGSDGSVDYAETSGSTVTVTDVNESPALFVTGEQSLELREGTSMTADTGYVVSATDPDAANKVTVTVDDDRFEIVDGSLRVKADQTFNYETEPTVSVTVTATDQHGARSSETVSVSITDVNEKPFLALRGAQTLSIPEGTAAEASTGIQVIAADPDGDELQYSVSDDRFEVRDKQIFAKSDSVFDFEEAASVSLTVTVTDPDGHKLTDINVTDDALGSYSLALAEDTPDIFELRGNRDDGWSLWIRDGAVVDFETLGSEVRAMIEMTASGVGTTPPAREFTLTIENELESVNKINLVNLVSEWQHGVELQAGTKLADIVLTGRKQHVGKSNHWERITLSGEDSQFFTIVDGELRLARDLTPDISAKAGYSVRLRYNETVILVDYELQVVEPAIQSAGSRGDVFQRPPDDVADDGLNDPLHDDLALPQMDVV